MAVKCIRKLYKFHTIQTTVQCCKFATIVPDDEGAANNSLDTKRLTNLKRLLRSKNVVVKDGFTCLLLPSCYACQALNQNAAYINKRTGLFMCPSCDITKPFGVISDIYEKNQRFNQTELSASPYNSKFSNVSDVTSETCNRLGIRGLKEGDVKAAGGDYVEDSDLIRFMLKNNAQRIVGEKILHLKDKQEETFQNKNNSGLVIYGGGNKNKAIIVTNLLDYLALVTQRLDNYTIICLPYGLKYLPQECLPAFEKYKELVFWFKFDSAGWDVAKNFSSKLDEKRCLLIRPTDTEPAPLEANQKRLNLRHILAKATPVQHKSITTFSALKNDILSELQNIEKVSGIKWKRFPILNKLLKGHRKGELTILTGPTGSGKTTFISEYSLDLALQGVSTLWGSFEIRNSRLAATLLRQFVGYSLENKLNEFEYWAERFEKYPLYFMTFHGQQPLRVVMDAIEHAQYVYDINHVIIDNLQFMMGLSMSHRTDKFWEQDAIIAAFRAFATKHNVHVTLVMHPRKERETDDLTTSSIFGTAKATQEADNVLIIQDKRLTSLRGKKYLQVAKNRFSGDLGIMPLDFDKESLSYSSIKKKIEQKEKAKTLTVSPY